MAPRIILTHCKVCSFTGLITVSRFVDDPPGAGRGGGSFQRSILVTGIWNALQLWRQGNRRWWGLFWFLPSWVAPSPPLYFTEWSLISRARVESSGGRHLRPWSSCLVSPPPADQSQVALFFVFPVNPAVRERAQGSKQASKQTSCPEGATPSIPSSGTTAATRTWLMDWSDRQPQRQIWIKNIFLSLSQSPTTETKCGFLPSPIFRLPTIAQTTLLPVVSFHGLLNHLTIPRRDGNCVTA